jgi:hypothetical protein
MSTDVRTCPHCGGEIKVAAALCKHCHQPVPAATSIPASTGMSQTSATSSPPPVMPPQASPPSPPYAANPGSAGAPPGIGGGFGATTTPTVSPEDLQLRDLLVSRGLVTAAHLGTALSRRTGADTDLLAFLQNQGLITAGQIENIRTAQREVFTEEATRLGEFAVQRMMITREQLAEALEAQRTAERPTPLGELLVLAKYITPAQRDALVREVAQRRQSATPGIPGVVSKGRTAVLGQWQRFRTLPSRTQALIGGGAGLGLLLIIVLAALLGGKPEIEPDCTLNGYGVGKCNFTNRGSKGSICGYLYGRCNNDRTATSSTICSGEVGTNETKSVPVSFVDFGEIADRYGGRWKDNCSFAWRTQK